MEFKHVIEWDYLGYNNSGKSYSSPQIDWNQTLMTTINIITNQMFKEQNTSLDSTLIVNEKVFEIIKTLFYYDLEKKLLGRNKVIVVNNEENCIIIDHGFLNKLPFVLVGGGMENDMKIIKVEMFYNLNDDKILEVVKNNYGMIKIKNYE